MKATKEDYAKSKKELLKALKTGSDCFKIYDFKNYDEYLNDLSNTLKTAGYKKFEIDTFCGLGVELNLK